MRAFAVRESPTTAMRSVQPLYWADPSNRRPTIHDPWAGRRSPSGRSIVCFDPQTWRDTINPSSLAGPPAVHQAAVRTVRLGHCVRKLPEGILVDIDARGKISTRGRAVQH